MNEQAWPYNVIDDREKEIDRLGAESRAIACEQERLRTQRDELLIACEQLVLACSGYFPTFRDAQRKTGIGLWQAYLNAKWAVEKYTKGSVKPKDMP